MRKKLIARHKTEEEIVFGLRYDEDKQELFVGGPDTMQAAVTEAMRECFELMTDFAENNAFKKGHRMRLLWRDVSERLEEGRARSRQRVQAAEGAVLQTAHVVTG